MTTNDSVTGLCVDDLLLDKLLISRLQAWINSREPGVSWVTGHRGTGVSTMVRILVQDMDVVWIATNTPWSRQFFGLATSTSSVLRPKIVVIEEFDEVLTNEVMHADLATLIKSSPKLPIVCVGHHRTGRAASLCRGANTFHFPAISSASLATYLEGRGLASLHADSSAQSIDVGQAMMAGKYNSSHTDVSLKTEDAVHAILGKRVQFQDALRMYDQDAGVGIGVFENYLHTTTSMDIDATTADHFSFANVLEEYERRYDWADTSDYQAVHMVGAPLLSATTNDLGSMRFGTMWSKLQNQCSKAKSVKHIQLKRAELGLGSTSIQDIAFFRQLISNSMTHEPECVKRVCRSIGLDHVATLQTMRLWPCEYKLSTHAKVKRWIE